MLGFGVKFFALIKTILWYYRLVVFVLKNIKGQLGFV